MLEDDVFHAIVCIKQVPETTDVRINPDTNTLMREGVKSIINELNLPEDDIGATLINGRHVEEDCELQEGDTLSIFPLVGGG